MRFASTLALLATVCPALAADDAPSSVIPQWITPLLSERARGEFVDWFQPLKGRAEAGAESYAFFGNQLRFGAKVKIPYLQLVVEGQDVRLADLPNDANGIPGEGNLGPGANYFANSPGLNGDTSQGETALHQANATIAGVPGLTGLAVTGGRFEYSDGLETMPSDPALAWLKRARIGERLIGVFGYSQYGRAFDGGRITWDDALVNLTAIAARPTHGGYEKSATRELGDVGFAGVTATLKELPGLSKTIDARLFYLAYEDNRFGDDRDQPVHPVKVDNRPAAVRAADTKSIRIHNVGGHVVTVADAGPGRVDGLLWGVWQSGDWGDQQHEAWAYAAEAGYQLPSLWSAPWLRVGVNQSSGDDDPNDNRHETFFEMLPTVRIYAQTPFFSQMNMQDLFAQLIVKPHAKVIVRLDHHVLRLSERKDLWYSGAGATNDDIFGYQGLSSGDRRNLAELLDLSVTWNVLQGLTAYAYYGHVFGQGVVRADFSGSQADYGYVELTYKY